MSANVDQRSKGQPNQVSSSTGNDVRKEDDPYLQHAPQHPIRSWSDQATDGAYGAPPMSNTNVSDSFFQSYYNPNMSYPFMNQGINTSEGPWSNGAENMFGMGYDYSFYGGFGMPFNNWEYAGEYWGNSQQVRKDQRGYPSEDAYYSPEMIPTDSYNMMNGAPASQEVQEPIGTIDQGLRGMSLQSSGGSSTQAPDPHNSSNRKKIVDISQPPVMVSPSDSFGGGEPSLMMAAPSSSHSVSSSHSSMGGGGASNQGGQPKKTSWAAIASQPARPQQQMRPRTIPRAPVNPNKPHNMDIGTWDTRGTKAPGLPVVQPPPTQVPGQRQTWGVAPRPRQQPQAVPPHSSASPGLSSSSLANTNNNNNSTVVTATASSNNSTSSPPNPGPPTSSYSNYSGPSSNGGGPRAVPVTSNGEVGETHHSMAPAPVGTSSHPVLAQLKSSNLYNPKEFNLNPKSARFFIIKSYSEDDIHRSIKYNIWCSTEHGNKRLDQAFREREGKGPVYLIYSVNGSGHFCGIAQMMTPVDYNTSAGVWAQDKWKGQFEVKWVYVKDVPNSQLRHIRLENNENKPVTNSRDTQEVPLEKGKQVLRIVHSYKHSTSIFDDFIHYEKRQEEDRHPPSYGRNDHRDHRGSGNDRDHHRGGERDHRGGGGDRGDHRGGDRGDHRGGDRGDHRGGDHRDHRAGGDRDHRGGDRDHRGGDRDHRGGDRGDRDGGRNRDNRRRQN